MSKDDDRLVIIVSNAAYLSKARQTIEAVRNQGAYDGPLLLVHGNDLLAATRREPWMDKCQVDTRYFPDLDISFIREKIRERPFAEKTCDNREHSKTFQVSLLSLPLTASIRM